MFSYHHIDAYAYVYTTNFSYLSIHYTYIHIRFSFHFISFQWQILNRNCSTRWLSTTVFAIKLVENSNNIFKIFHFKHEKLYNSPPAIAIHVIISEINQKLTSCSRNSFVILLLRKYIVYFKKHWPRIHISNIKRTRKNS